MGKRVIKGYNRLIAFLLSVLGIGSSATFSGCGDNYTCEYGTPRADFKVSGVVTDGEDKAVEGIKVVMHRAEGYDKDSTYTDENGNYNVGVGSFPQSQTFSMQFVDVDGSDNKTLQQLDTAIVFTNPEFKNGDGNWYEGETSQELNISMKDGQE